MATQPDAILEKRKNQRGFTLLELAIATVVLLVGIISVVKLVPASIQSNTNSRNDTMVTVIAQRFLEQLALQPLSANTFTDADGNVLSLGNPATPGVVVGSPLTAGTTTINFAAGPVAGYNRQQYVDPNNPNGGSYDVRWAVITTTTGGSAVVKRFIVGARRVSSSRIALTTTLDTTVSK